MHPLSKALLAACTFTTLAACSGGDQESSDNPQSIEEQFDVLLVQEFWDENVSIAQPCEDAATQLSAELEKQAVQEARVLAADGLALCQSALEAQSGLKPPEQVEDETFHHLTLATIDCREALNARRKFFEAATDVLEGDTSEWRLSLAQTASDVAQARSLDCIQHFVNAGLEI